MKTFIQPGDVLDLAAPYARNGGEGAKIGSIFGVACRTLANAEVGPFMVSGVHQLAKTDSQAWTVGAKIYWDDSTKLCTTAAAAGANLQIGVAVEAVGAGAGLVLGKVRLSGAFTI
jgi:predicted RecA/RadA family phage recombinase